MKKLISQKMAKEKYGVVVSKMQKLDKIKFYLLDNGNVVDSMKNIRHQNPLNYGDYQSKSIKWLDKKSGEIIDFFRERLERDELDKFYELLEIERELTLREEQPY